MEPKFCTSCGKRLSRKYDYKFDAFTGARSIKNEWRVCPNYPYANYPYASHDFILILKEPKNGPAPQE
jgi:hypothetical protein